MSAISSVWRRIEPIFRAVGLLPSAGQKEPKGRKTTIYIPRPRLRIEPTCYLSVVAIVKNEGRYLREWLEFQRLMGADHVHLYDNGSTDNTDEVSAPFVAEGFVTVIPWTSFDAVRNPQRQAYAHALCNFGPHFRWMAFIDIDEFLFPVAASNLVEVLAEYEDLPCLCVPWNLFGPSGHTRPQSELVIENFTRALFPLPPHLKKLLLNWKNIAQPAKIAGIYNPHLFALMDGRIGGFNENKIFVTKKHANNGPWVGSVVRVNHYYARPRVQMFPNTGDPLHAKRQARAEALERETLVQDKIILRFAPQLRRRMKLD